MAWRHIFEGLPAGRTRQARRESNYLRDLSPDGINLRSEVGQIVRAARLTRTTASVSTYRTVYSHTLYEEVECAAGNHVLKCLPRWLITEARRVRHYLRQLAPGYGIARAEGAIRVASDDCSTGQAFYVGVESAALLHVSEADITGRDCSGRARSRCVCGCARHTCIGRRGRLRSPRGLSGGC
jgi:hypothetical protein